MSAAAAADPIMVQDQKLVAPEPEHCPGPESQQAGQADACVGCPNREICASSEPKGPDPDLPVLTARLAPVKHKILVLSGKGGVGKSTFSVLLARAFAAMFRKRRAARPDRDTAASDGDDDDDDDNRHTDSDSDSDSDSDELDPLRIGLLDADITGPSIPKMLSVEGEPVHVSAAGWTPMYPASNLAAISIQNLLPPGAADRAVIWRGAKKTGLLKQFLRDVEWGPLDLLLVDTPPGTSDEHLALCTFLRDAGIDGAVLVTTPQEVALLDVRKEVDFCRKAGIPILGLAENMAGFACGGCGTATRLFRPTTGGARELARAEGIPFLGSVPIDPRLGLAGDFGEDFLATFPDSLAGKRISRIVRRVARRIELEIEEGVSAYDLPDE